MSVIKRWHRCAIVTLATRPFPTPVYSARSCQQTRGAQGVARSSANDISKEKSE